MTATTIIMHNDPPPAATPMIMILFDPRTRKTKKFQIFLN